MSDDGQNPPPTQEEVKAEDGNAPINVKVCLKIRFFFTISGLFLALAQVVSSTGDEVFFKIKRSTKLSKLQGAYASKVGKEVSSIRYVTVGPCKNKVTYSTRSIPQCRFLYDGARITETDTPSSLDMDDNGTRRF